MEGGLFKYEAREIGENNLVTIFAHLNYLSCSLRAHSLMEQQQMLRKE